MADKIEKFGDEEEEGEREGGEVEEILSDLDDYFEEEGEIGYQR